MRTLGVDLASQPNRTAMATIEWSDTGAEVTAVQHGVTDGEILDSLQSADRSGIDAPFGWPDAFAQLIDAHQDGRSAEEVEFFAEPGVTRFVRRLTDEKVRTSFGLVPLSVSADRIAYVALRAVRLLAQLDGPGFDVDRANGTAVEAYPAAALKVWGLSHNKYKGLPQQAVLSTLLSDLETIAPWLDFGAHRKLCATTDDAFDAVITALIARAAALGLTHPPDEMEAPIARREGWIHVPSAPLSALDPRI